MTHLNRLEIMDRAHVDALDLPTMSGRQPPERTLVDGQTTGLICRHCGAQESSHKIPRPDGEETADTGESNKEVERERERQRCPHASHVLQVGAPIRSTTE